MKGPDSNDRTNQHFVPKGYLKAWRDIAAAPRHHKVWQIDKRSGLAKLESARTILREPDIYTDRAADGSRSLFFEETFKVLEDNFYAVRDRAIAAERDLDSTQWAHLLVFVAAQRWRTQLNRNQQVDQWTRLLTMAESMKASIAKASPEQRAAASSMASRTGSSPGLTLDQVRTLSQRPLQVTLAPALKVLVNRFTKLDSVLLTTSGAERFITSDNPCVLFDPEARARGPMRAIADIDSPTIEVTMALTPRHCVWIGELQGSTHPEILR